MRDAKEKKSEPRPVSIDMDNRDPTHMNEHLALVFQDIIAEPNKETYSTDKVWANSYRHFNSSKVCCYRTLSTVCAVPAAIYWGIVFACLAFCHIWCLQPWLKAIRVNLSCLQTVISIITDTFIKPIVDVLSRCLSNIHVTHAQGKPRDPSAHNLHMA